MSSRVQINSCCHSRANFLTITLPRLPGAITISTLTWFLPYEVSTDYSIIIAEAVVHGLPQYRPTMIKMYDFTCI